VARWKRRACDGTHALAAARHAAEIGNDRAALRLYERAFALDPALAGDMVLRHRYNAACVASIRASDPAEPRRAEVALQSIRWLEADLAALRAEAGAGRIEEASDALRAARGDPDLAALRDESALAAWTPEVREACIAF
jgi:hypothetical protein